MAISLSLIIGVFVAYSDWAVHCDDAVDKSSSGNNLCRDICSGLLPLLPNSVTICERGCRFFNIIHLQSERNVTKSTGKCLLSCREAYLDSTAVNVCTAGCNTIARDKLSASGIVPPQPPPALNIFDLQQLKISKNDGEDWTSIFAADDDNNIENSLLEPPELELLEEEESADDGGLLNDPIVQGEFEFSYDVEYKIPETKVRTLPISAIFRRGDRSREAVFFGDDGDNGVGPDDFGYKSSPPPTPKDDWLDCVARNVHIPRWILLPLILSAVVFALWLTFATFAENHDPEMTATQKQKVKRCAHESEYKVLIDLDLEVDACADVVKKVPVIEADGTVVT